MEVEELVLCVPETRSNRLRGTRRTVILNVILNQVNRIQNGRSAVSTAALFTSLSVLLRLRGRFRFFSIGRIGIAVAKWAQIQF